MKITIALAFLVMLELNSLAQCDRFHFCGRVLSETLVKYCQSGITEKRSESWMRTKLFGAGYWLSPQLAMGMGKGKRTEGIATKCCENSCSMDELLAYCPYK